MKGKIIMKKENEIKEELEVLKHQEFDKDDTATKDKLVAKIECLEWVLGLRE
jgi:hypothetical protein